MTRFFEFLKRQPMMTAVLALMIAMAGVGLPQESYLTRAVLRVLLTGTMLFLLSLISGEKTLSQGDNQTAYVFRHLMGFLILAAIAGVLIAVGTVVQGQVRPGILLRLVTLLLLFLFVGLFEELCFRAVLNDAMICQFRSSRAVFVWSAVFSSLIFGAVHVIGSPLTGAVEVLEAVLKTLSTAIVGFAFLILYWKTRNIWALALVHGAYDFLASFPLVLGSSEAIGAGSYVREGTEGKIVAVVYMIQIVIVGLITLRVWRKVGKTIDFDNLRESW